MDNTNIRNIRWRKKSVVIEAVRFDGISFGGTAPIWLVDAIGDGVLEKTTGGKLAVNTMEGIMTLAESDWLIRGVKNELYPCKPDIFEATYEPADEGAPANPVMPELRKPTLKMQDGSEPPPYIARMIIEYEELGERLRKLGAFIWGNQLFNDLPNEQRGAMKDQHVAMEEYYSALMRRLAYMGAMTS